MAEFFKAPFLVLHLSSYIFMTFMIMLFLILLSMLMILLSTLSMIKHLICAINYRWILNLNLIYQALCAGAKSGCFNWMLEKCNLFCLTSLITLVLLLWKWMDYFLRKNNLLRCCGCLSLLNWIGAITLSLLLKLTRKLEPWFVPLNFFLLELLCISINLPYCHAWNIVVTSRLVLLAASRC